MWVCVSDVSRGGVRVWICVVVQVVLVVKGCRYTASGMGGVDRVNIGW